RDRSEHLEERFLDQILHVAVRAEDAEQGAMDAIAVGEEHLALRCPIAARAPLRELAVGGGTAGIECAHGHVSYVSGIAAPKGRSELLASRNPYWNDIRSDTPTVAVGMTRTSCPRTRYRSVPARNEP